MVIRQKPKDGSYGSGSRGTSFFWIGYRPGEERGRTVFRFPAEPTHEIRVTHVAAVVPPERPFELDYADADGKVVTFEIEPRFLADVVRRADIVALELERWGHSHGFSSTSGSINCARCSRAKPSTRRPWFRYTLMGWLMVWRLTRILV